MQAPWTIISKRSYSYWNKGFLSTFPGKNPGGLQGWYYRSFRISVSVSHSGVIVLYLKTPSAGYIVNTHHASMKFMITGFTRLI